ncbi:hypothetical protein D3C80_1263770 [compost metagenome]
MNSWPWRIGTSVCQVVCRLPFSRVPVCCRLLMAWLCRREMAAAARRSSCCRSPSSSMALSSREGSGNAPGCGFGLTRSSMPRAPRARAGRVRAKVLGSRAGAPGAVTEAWVINLSRWALRSVATLAGKPPSSFASRKVPLLFRAWATALASPSWRTSGSPASKRSALLRRLPSAPGSRATCCNALSRPVNEAWRFCWVSSCWAMLSWSCRPLSGTNCSDWSPCTRALSRLPTGSGRGLSMVRVAPACALLSRLTSAR